MSMRDDDEPNVEELARFLFLEDAISDRRVLIVGHRSLALGPALLELGARRVVMALEDSDLVEQSRALPHIVGLDHRLVREGVLPGDDGAFDLVVDFSLPFSLASGQEWKKDEIRRLLSRDGFALTALPNDALAGLPGFYPRRETLPRRSYRELAQELVESFDVVEVYFQSLLLGFFFGSFEVDPGDDGVAPHTGLMGEEAEPASYYVFAFGNAVPVIADVSLVQMPLARLLKGSPSLFAANANALPSAGAQPSTRETFTSSTEEGAEQSASASDAPVDDAVMVALVEEVAALRSEIVARDDVLHELSVRVPLLRDQVAALVEEIATRTDERDGMARLAEDLEVALVARDQHLELAERELSERRARMLQLEAEVRRATDVVRERTTWVEAGQGAIEQMEQDLVGMTAERDALVHRVLELEGVVVSARADQESRGRRASALADELDEAKSALANAARLLDDARTASRRAAELPALEARLAVVEDERAALAEALDERDAAMRALTEERDRLSRACDEQHEERIRLADGVNALVEARAALQARVDGLVAERAKVDEELAVLRGEADAQRGRVVALESERENLLVVLEERSGATERAAHLDLEKTALATELQGVRERLRSAQASVEERAREVGQARDLFQEIAGQRDTLNQVVVARDRELNLLKTELSARASEIDRLTAEVVELRKSSADLTVLVDEIKGSASSEHQRVVELRQKLDEESRARAQAERDLDDALTMMRDVEQREHEVVAALGERDKLLTTVRADLSTRDEELVALSGALRAHEATVAELEHARRALEDQVQAERVTSNAHEARARAVASTQASLERELAEAGARLASVEDETSRALEALATRERDVREQLAILSQQAATEQARLQVLVDGAATREAEREARLEARASEIAHAAEALQDARAALAVLADEKDALTRALAETEGRVDEMRAALDSERAEHAATRTNLAEATRALDEVSRTAEGLSAEKAASETRTREASEALHTLRDELAAAMALLDEESRTKERLTREHAETVERARGNDGELRAAIAREVEAHSETRLRVDELTRTLDETERTLAALLPREELLTALLDEAQRSATRAEAERALQAEILHEAQRELAKERARGDLLFEELAEAQALLRDGEASVALLRAELEELQGDAALLSREHHASRDALQAAEENLLAEWTRSETLRNQVRALEAGLHDSNARVALHQAQLEEAQAALSEESARASLMGAELDDARATFDRVRADSRDLLERASAERDALRAEREGIDAELRNLREKRSEGLAERDALLATRAALDDEKRSVEQELEQADARADSWETRALDAENKLETAAADAEAARENAVRARRELFESEATRSVLAEELRSLREGEERAADDRRRADDMARLLEVERAERRSLEEQMRAFSSESGEAAQFRTRIASLETEQSNMQGLYDAARERVRALEDDAWRAEEALHAEREERARAEEALRTASAEQARLDDELRSLRESAGQTSTLPREAGDDDVATLREELRAERAHARRLEEEVAGLADGYREAEAARGLLERDMVAVRARIEELEQELTFANDHMSSMKTASDGSRVRDLEELVARLRTDLDEKNDRINRLTQRLVSVEGL
jgi:chromosome segregation ATPase